MLRVGECVKVARIAKGFTLAKLGKLTGTGKAYLSMVENQRIAPPMPKILKRICTALDLDYIRMLALRQVDPLKMPAELSVEALASHIK